MGAQPSDICCLCYPYNEEGEYRSIFLSQDISDNNNNNNDRNSNNDRLYNTFNSIFYQILSRGEGSQNESDDNNNSQFQSINISSKLFDNDVSQLDSRILENIEDLCPEKKRCTICLENYIQFDKIINLSCLHMFHDSCIKTWLKKHDYCPICKNKIDF